MQSRRRWIWPILLSVLCGTIITLLLAIVGPALEYALYTPAMTVWSAVIADDSREIYVERTRWWLCERWQRVDLGPGASFYRWWSLVPAPVVIKVDYDPPIPYWALREYRPTDDGPRAAIVDTIAHGFPFRAFRAVHWNGTVKSDHREAVGPEFGTKSSWDFGTWNALGREFRLFIPNQPIWLGLAADVAIWSSAFWLLISWPSIRRTLRRRRGLCERCAYDLRASTNGRCPECGTQKNLPAAANPKVAAPISNIAP